MPSPSKSSASSVATALAIGSTTSPCASSDVRLEIIELTYSNSHEVNNDTYGKFLPPEWLKGRKADPALSKQLPEQFPVAYIRNTKLKLTAKFRVVESPACVKYVWVKGRALVTKDVVMEWSMRVEVSPGQPEALASDMEGSVNLPNHITYYDPFTIEWTSNAGGSAATRHAAGVSRNPLYVLLGPPAGAADKLFWTLIDVSCRHAVGKQDEKGAVSGFYKAFKGAQSSPPKAITRKRDGKMLTYWDPPDFDSYDTFTLLSSSQGCGRCGAWSNFMIDMCKVHGIMSARRFAISYDEFKTALGWDNQDLGLLVKYWSFAKKHDILPALIHTARGNTFSFAHYLSVGCINEKGVAAQGNNDPVSIFLDHAIVKFDNKYYDPSYGTGPFFDELAWETGSLDGVFYHKSRVPLCAHHPQLQVFKFYYSP